MTVDRIGRLRHRLTIEQPIRSGDDGGGATLTWGPVASVWAEVIARSGREIVQGNRTTARSNYRIVMRYRADLDPTMRLRSAERIFEILAIRDEDGRKCWTTCDCEERGP